MFKEKVVKPFIFQQFKNLPANTKRHFHVKNGLEALLIMIITRKNFLPYLEELFLTDVIILMKLGNFCIS